MRWLTNKSRRDLLYGGPALCGNRMEVSIQLRCTIRSVLRSFSSAWPTSIVLESMSESRDSRTDERVRTAFECVSSVIPENRVL